MSGQSSCGRRPSLARTLFANAVILGLISFLVLTVNVTAQEAPSAEDVDEEAPDAKSADPPKEAQQQTGTATRPVIDKIVVTAQKREESVQSVPIAIQAYEGETIHEMGIKKASDVTKLAPNLNISTMNAANQQINIRGVGTVDFFGNASGSVGLYMDEVTMSAPYLSGLGLYDLERVEVLRGPQNSLFGRNTTGGAVNYISKRPVVGGDSAGTFNFSYGRFNMVELEGGYTFQLGDKSAARLAGTVYRRDGIWDNLAAEGDTEYGRKNRYSFRGTYLAEPSDRTTVTVNGHWAREDSQIDPYRYVGLRGENGSPEFFTVQPGPVPTGPPPGEELDFTSPFGGLNAQGVNVETSDWNDIVRIGHDGFDIDSYGFYFKVEHDLDWASLTSITSYDHSEIAFTLDLGGPASVPTEITMINTQDQKFDQFSQELRLTSTRSGRFRWIAGLYAFYEESLLGQSIGHGPFSFDTSQPLTVPGGPPIPGQPVGGSFGFWALIAGAAPANANGYGNQAGFSIADLENEVISPYLHSEYDLSDDWTLTVGLRYSRDEKRAPSLTVGNVSVAGLPRDQFQGNDVIRQLSAGLAPCDFDGDGNVTGGTPDNRGLPCVQTLRPEDLTFNELGGKLGLTWRAKDDLLLYGHYSRGFRSGKYDIEFFHGPQTGFARRDQDVEILNTVELGIKSQGLGGSLLFNAAAFFSRWDDQQLFDVDPFTGPVFLNVAESELWGSEFELKWAVNSRFLLQLGVGFLDSEITDEGDDLFGLVEEGHELPYAPDFSANFAASYDIAVGSLGVLTLRSDVKYQSESFTKLRDVPFINEYGSHFDVNARIGFTLFGEGRFYEMALVGENLAGDQRCSFELDLFALAGGAYCWPNDGVPTWAVQTSIRF